MRTILTACAFLVVVLLAACGSTAPLVDEAVTPGDRDPDSGLVRPTIAPVTKPSVPPAQGTDDDSGGEAAMIVAGVGDAPPVLGLVEDARQRGIELKPAGESRAEFLADAPGQTYQVGSGWLHVHLYPDTEAARAKQAIVRQGLDNPVASWPGPPHAYQCGELIIVYFGIDGQLAQALVERCGPQFAGTS